MDSNKTVHQASASMIVMLAWFVPIVTVQHFLLLSCGLYSNPMLTDLEFMPDEAAAARGTSRDRQSTKSFLFGMKLLHVFHAMSQTN